MPRYDYDNSYNFKTMTLTGQGQINAVPDMAVIRLGVETAGDDLSAIQTENAQLSQAVIDFLRSSGISDVKTYRYSVDRRYEYENGNQIDRGFTVSNIFEIRLEEMERVGAVIDGAIANGANTVDFISFEISDVQSYYQQALNQAVINAMDKADSLAVLLGLTAAPVPVKIIENSAPVMPFSQRVLSERTFTTPIEPGNLTIEAYVSVDFSF